MITVPNIFQCTDKNPYEFITHMMESKNIVFTRGKIYVNDTFILSYSNNKIVWEADIPDDHEYYTGKMLNIHTVYDEETELTNFYIIAKK